MTCQSIAFHDSVAIDNFSDVAPNIRRVCDLELPIM